MLKAIKQAGHKHKLKSAIGDYDVPSFPALAMQALQVARSSSSSAADVADILTQDPGLSVRILGAVNSSAYALRRRIDSLPQAVALLGMTTVESLVAAVAVGRVYRKVEVPGFDRGAFWQTSARRASMSQTLAQRVSPRGRAEGFTAALLQDMAVPLLAASRPKQHGPIREAWKAGEGRLVDLEREVFGFDHAQVGGWLCDEWSLPASLRMAIESHHEPPGSVEDVSPLVGVVAPLREAGPNDGAEDVLRLCEQMCDLSREELEELMQESFARAGELALLFGG